MVADDKEDRIRLQESNNTRIVRKSHKMEQLSANAAKKPNVIYTIDGSTDPKGQCLGGVQTVGVAYT